MPAETPRGDGPRICAPLSIQRALVCVVATITAGCAASLGSVNVLQPQFDTFGVKVLAPSVSGRSCRTSILGMPLQPGDPDVQEALAQILAHDAEGDVVTDARIGSERILTGVYNRSCVSVHGNLGRTIRVITLPMPASHQGHH
jgi:hypothetical protein